MNVFFCMLIGFLLSALVTRISSRLSEKNSNFDLRGHCDNCLRSLYLFESIPIFSYIFLRGRCRSCKEKIDPLYFVQEVLNTLIYGLIIFKMGLTIRTVIYCITISCLLIYCYIDLRKNENSKIMIGVLSAIGVISIIVPEYPWYEYVIGFFVGFGVIAIASFIFKSTFCGGRYIGVYAACGAIFGYKTILISIGFALIFLLIWIIIFGLIHKNKHFIKTHFSPLMLLGTVLSILTSDFIISYVERVFF